VCSEPLQACALMDCGHRTCCALCATRLCLLHNDKKCVLCKQVPEKVFVVPLADRRTHAELAKQSWGDRTSGFALDDASGFFFAETCRASLVRLQRLREPRCTKCAQTFGSSVELQRHLESGHQQFLCALCLEFAGKFLMEHPRMTRAQLQLHSRSGEAKLGFAGHPTCKFCQAKAFYNDDHLYKHLKEEHESCFLCTRAGQRFQYFEHYSALQTHFAAEHFLCPDPRCLENRFCVFLTELELHGHFASEHPGRLDSKNIALDFVYRGSQRDRDRDGGGGSRASSDRAVAPAARLTPEEFPSLGATSRRAAGPASSWRPGAQLPRPSRSASSSRPGFAVQDQDDFPAFQRSAPATSASNLNSAAAGGAGTGFGGGPGAADRTFGAAPYSAASRPGEGRAEFPSLPKPTVPRPKSSAIERYAQAFPARAAPRDVRGPRQDEALRRNLDEDDNDAEQELGAQEKKRNGRRKPGGKNGKVNMVGLFL
jgi:hypothetical protein